VGVEGGGCGGGRFDGRLGQGNVVDGQAEVAPLGGKVTLPLSAERYPGFASSSLDMDKLLKAATTTATRSPSLSLDKNVEEEDDDAQEKRAAVVDAIETVQVIAALLAGTGIAFMDDLSSDEGLDWENELIRGFVILFVGLNMYGLIVLSSQLFYLRQCLAKDISMFEPFVKATKDTRYFALKGVLYSM
jgi:hypothetical protein